MASMGLEGLYPVLLRGECDGLAVDAKLGCALSHEVQPRKRTAHIFPIPISLMPGEADVQGDEAYLVNRVRHGFESFVQRKQINHKDATDSAFFSIPLTFLRVIGQSCRYSPITPTGKSIGL